ncbi:hypothetical protein [Streptomyces sp. NPDC050528]|uniref:hypothetical protein n=1 Tax=Streptomyces sp. NPDC050528 TaxID=3365623 RepID=UPI0037896303
MTVLVMQAGATFWDSLAFDGIDDVDVEEAAAAFGTVGIVASGWAAGRAGGRQSAELGFRVGRMTLLHRVMALPDPRPSTPHVLGVDDFATCRGQTYSTVLTCEESHRVVDVLPTRDSGPPAARLGAHPGVEIICRTGQAPLPRAHGSALPPRSRPPTGFICGRASAGPWRPASPPPPVSEHTNAYESGC